MSVVLMFTYLQVTYLKTFLIKKLLALQLRPFVLCLYTGRC